YAMSTSEAIPSSTKTVSQSAAATHAPAIAYRRDNHFAIDISDVEYRRDGDEVFIARVYQPRGTGPFPAMVDIHGGQWARGDRTGNQPITEALAASGLVVFAPDFHLASLTTPYPTALVDVNYAVRWFKAHVGEFNGSSRHLGGMGSSSGGH